MVRDAIAGRSAIRMRGDVSIENNGGFVQIVLDLSPMAQSSMPAAGAVSNSTYSAMVRSMAFICGRTHCSGRGNLIAKLSRPTRIGGRLGCRLTSLFLIALMIRSILAGCGAWAWWLSAAPSLPILLSVGCGLCLRHESDPRVG